MKFGFSQPIEMRVNELVAGVKSDVAALIYGPDLDVLRRLSLEIERVLSQIPGRTTSRTRPRAGCRCCGSRSAATSWRATGSRPPTCSTRWPRWAARRSAPSSRTTSGTRSRSGSPSRGATIADKIGSIRVVDPQGRPIPLKDLAEIAEEEGPNEVERENVQHRAVVGVNVRGRDIASFVAEAQAAIDDHVQDQFPPATCCAGAASSSTCRPPRKRLMIVVPVAMLLIFLLLYSTFHSIRLALLIYTAVPMAATGGVFALFLRGLPFSISAGVGFIALFGVAVLNGLVWVSAVEHLRQEGVEPHEAAREAAVVRLRPILMTALVAGLGFIPMAIATTPGAEIQRPLATVVIGGLITSTLLTTLVLPAIYPWFAQTSRHQSSCEPGSHR